MTSTGHEPEITARQLQNTFGPLLEDKRSRDPIVTKPEVIDQGSMARDLEGLQRADLTRFKIRELEGVESIDPSLIGLGHDEPVIVLFLSRSGSGKLDRIRQAVRSPHGARVVQSELLEQGVPRERSVRQSVRELIGTPVYAEFRYADFSLADHIWLPEAINLNAYVFPYNGARLSADGFSLTQWRRTESAPELEALVVINAPPKTGAEAAVDLERPIIQPERVCETTWWGVAGAVIMYCAGAAAACGPSPEAFDVPDLGDEIRRRFGDTPSVDDLIDLRMFAALKDE